jgi:hypothetical protein
VALRDSLLVSGEKAFFIAADFADYADSEKNIYFGSA